MTAMRGTDRSFVKVVSAHLTLIPSNAIGILLSNSSRDKDADDILGEAEIGRILSKNSNNTLACPVVFL